MPYAKGHGGRETKWELVADVLRERCRLLEEGESLGTLHALAIELDVPLSRVESARYALEREGWVRLEGKRGLIRTHRNPDAEGGADAPPEPVDPVSTD